MKVRPPKPFLRYAFLGVLLTGLAGCAASGSSRSRKLPVVDAPDLPTVERILRQAASDWHGTPHVRGGTSREGTDCSGFVMRIFENRLDLPLPRSTQMQVDAGVEVDRRELQAGDLVLFHTGLKTRHVGIYLSGNEFAHVSSSRGVTISNMTTPYWQEAYWTARRVMRPAAGSLATSSASVSSSPSPSPHDARYGW